MLDLWRTARQRLADPSRGSSPEMRRVDFLVGTWTGRFAPPSEGEVTCQVTWVGQGEYLLVQEDYGMPPNSYLACLSLVGYDAYAKVYRRWSFFPKGGVPEEWEGRFEGTRLVFSIEAPTGQPRGEWEAEKKSPAATLGMVGLLADTAAGKGSLTVGFVTPGSPAFSAGLRKRDLILKIDGQPARTLLPGKDVITHLSGPAGSSVRLTIRTGESEREVTLTRQQDPRYQGPNRREVFEPRPDRGYSRWLELKHWDRFEKGEEIQFRGAR